MFKSGFSDEFNEWVDRPSFNLEDKEEINRVNLLKGMAMGYQIRVEQLEEALAEERDRVALARRYQRELDARAIQAVTASVEFEYDEMITLQGMQRDKTYVTTIILATTQASDIIREVPIND